MYSGHAMPLHSGHGSPSLHPAHVSLSSEIPITGPMYYLKGVHLTRLAGQYWGTYYEFERVGDIPEIDASRR